jgi:conjugative relaxase-like TrwC/TraI family protein
MFTLKVQKDAKSSINYFEEHLSSNEKTAGYYVGGRDVSVGVWYGAAGPNLGLTSASAVTNDVFTRLISNQHPSEEKKITPRVKENRRLYFDGTMSAPKSVSIMALVADDQRLLIAHQEANAEALSYIQTLAQTRVRVKGKNELRKTGNILAAQFTHTTSRSNDPQLHTHNVIFNFTWDDVEKKYKALEASKIYNLSTLATEVYRNSLAKRVLDLGYEVESDVYGFKIKGVSSKLCDLYSKRSAAIRSAIENKEKEEDRSLSNNEKSHIAHKSRKAKNKDLNHSQIKEYFHSQISSKELSELKELVVSSQKKSQNTQLVRKHEKIHAADLVEKRDLLNEKIAINKGLMHAFERKSVVSFEDVLKAALQSNLGQLEFESLETALLERNDVFIKGELVISKEELAREWFCVNHVDSVMGKSKPIIEKIDDDFLSSLKKQGLRADQISALTGLLTNKDNVVSLRGAAGAGKSHTISLLIKELQKQNIEVLPLAPTAGAAENLRSEFSLDTMTLQRFLKSPLKEKKPKFLIVDEAGLCSLKQMKDLFSKAETLNARILLVGDTRQNLSVESGDSLRILEKFSQLETFELTKISRQKVEVYKRAVQHLVDLKVAESFELFSAMGSFKEHQETKENGNPLFKEVAKEYINDLNDKKKSLVVAFSWKDIDSITEEIRKELNNNKQITMKDAIKKSVFEDLSLTASERLSPNSFFKSAPELHVLLRKDVKGLKRNVPYKIISTDEKSFVLENFDNSSTTRFFVGFDKSSDLSPVEFNVVVKKDLFISSGEKLLLQANHTEEDKINLKKTKFLNGEIVSVKSATQDSIELDDGRTLPFDYNLMTYGYAVTSISSQGKTTDKVIVAASNSSGRAVSYNSFYVAASRGKNEISIHVNDLDRVKATLSAVAERESAMEFIRKTAKDLDPEEQKKWLEVSNESLKVFGQKEHQELLQEKVLMQNMIDSIIKESASKKSLSSLSEKIHVVKNQQTKDRLRKKRDPLYSENMDFYLKTTSKELDRSSSLDFLD